MRPRPPRQPFPPALLAALVAASGCGPPRAPRTEAGLNPAAGHWMLAADEAPPAPDFEYRPIDGSPPFRLSSLRGRVVVIDYWATW